MKLRHILSMAAVMALASTGALAQQNSPPTDPTSQPAGCTGFPGDPVECPRTQPNTTIPEQTAPDVNTQSGPDPLATPDNDGFQPNTGGQDSPPTNSPVSPTPSN
jgi:hypothetical protein